LRDLLEVPEFARLHDWRWAWAMEPLAFLALRDAVRLMDWRAHLAAAPPKVQSSLEMIPAKSGKSIAVVKAAGTLMKSQSSMGGTSTVQLRKDIRQAAADPNVSGILLAIDSPGGTVAGTWELANDVGRARQAKPVYAWVDDLAASAAYWAASQSSAVYAGNPTAKVGSIGTFQAVYDTSDAATKEGVKVHLISTGPLKGLGVPGTAVTDDHLTHLQTLVNEAQTHFDAAVRKGRGMTATQLAAVRSGGVFPAAEAADLKLIDGIKSFDKTVEALAAAR
jgi:signal peptide peptidase SppA